MTPDPTPRTAALLALLLAAALPYLIGLGDSAIWDANEAFYAETPREMIEAGDYINPAFNYEPRFNKPVLNYWVVAGFYHLFGVSVGVQRLPIALSALALMAAAFGIGRALRSTRAGVWAAIALAISPRVLMFARRIFIDMWVTMFMGLTLLCFVLAERHPERRGRYLLWMYVAIGLGVLTKGPVALVLPGLVIFVWLAINRRLGEIPRLRLATGALIVLAIVAPWYVALYLQHGWSHIVGFFWGENVARYADAVAPNRGVLFYPPVVFGDMFPASLLLIPAAVVAWREGRRSVDGRIRTLLWVWILVIVGFFTLSATKQDLYIFPIIVAIAALAGEMLDDEGRRTRLTAWMLGIAGGALCGAAALVLQLFGGSGRIYELEGVTAIAAIAGTGGLATLGLAIRGRVYFSAVALAAAMIALNWLFVLQALPSFERYKPVPQMSATILRHAGPNARVMHYNVALPSMVFYLRRHVDQFYAEPGPMIEAMETSPEYYLVLRETEYRELRDQFPGPTCVLERRPFFDVKLKAVLAREPVPALVLVTNRCR